MNKHKSILLVIVVSTLVFGQGYFGIKYPEPVIYTDAFDPFYGRKSLDQVRAGELIFGRLWRYNEKLNVEADLLESMPKPEKGGLFCVLKQGLQWPDGKPITVDDIIFTINCYRQNGEKRLRQIAIYTDCEKIDDRQFILKPNRKIRNFNYYTRLDFANIQILPKHILKVPSLSNKDAYVKRPIGSGPFQISNIAKDGAHVKIHYKRNPNYHEIPAKWEIKEVIAVSEPGFVQQVSSLITPNAISYVEGKDPNLDLLIEDISNKQQLIYLKGVPHIKHQRYVRNSWVGLALNVQKPFLNSSAFRRILDTMLDDRKLIRRNYGDDAEDITGPFLRGFGIYIGDIVDRTADEESIRGELRSQGFGAKAGKPLVWRDPKTGKETSVKFRLIYNKDFVSTGSREAHALTDIIREFELYGIDIIKDGLSRGEFDKKIEMPDYWDIAYLRYTFGWENNFSEIFKKNGEKNYTGYSHPELSADLKTMLTASDAQRREAGRRIQRHCYEKVPYLFLWHVKPQIHYRNIIKDLSITPGLFFTTIGKWWIEPR